MRGLILAAGIGKRLRPLTDKIPKALLKVGKKTVIEYMLDNFHYAGVKEVVIVVGFNQEAVRAKVGTSYKGMKIIYRVNEKYDKTNNLYSLYKARDALNGGFIQCHGDIIAHKDIIKRAFDSPVQNGVAADKEIVRDANDANRIRLEKGRVVQLDKKMPIEEASGFLFGIYKFSKEGAAHYVRHIEENKDNAVDGFEIALRPTMKEVRFEMIDVTGLPHLEIDNIGDFNYAVERVGDVVD